MKSLSFDGMVEFYDETRVFDRNCFDAALAFLIERFPPRVINRVLEPGIGTGRIAIPLAERGYQVVGVDISKTMMELLKKKLVQSEPLEISYLDADVTQLPFPGAAFDMSIAVHLFYFIEQWRKAADEILRVVKSESPIVIMHTGTGTEIPFLNERYKELAAQQGFQVKEIGVRSNKEVVNYLLDLGCNLESIHDRWQWVSRIRLDKALSYVKSRAYSFTDTTPDDIHATVITELELELKHRFDSLATEVEIPNEIYLEILQK